MYKSVKVSEFLHRVKVPAELQPEQEYSLVTIKVHHKGVVLRNKTKGKLIGSKMYKISKGQFILSGIDARNGAFGIVPDELDGAIVTNDFWYFDIDETKVKRDFFYWLTNTPLFLNACIKSSQGVTQRIRLQAKLFFDFEFRFPPLEEQENFLKRIQHADQSLILLRVELQKQERYISQLKQAILQEAIAGQLTAEWRDRHPMQKGNPDTDAAALLAKIKAEKRQLIADGKLKQEKPLPEIIPDKIPFSVPDSWVWCSLGNVGIFERGKSKHRPRNDGNLFKDGNIPFIQTGDVSSAKKSKGYITRCSQFYNEIGLAQSRLWSKDTLCITIAANIAETGFLGIDACFPDSIVGFTSLTNISMSWMIKYYLFCVQDEIIKFAPATAQKNINLNIITSLLFPLPPLAEQKAIVEKVDYLMKIIDQLQEQIKHRKQLAEDLMQTVLREAFE
ncbi:MAG: restriction endonuclease subunit S [Nostoc sp. NMS1]|uniref:restriction endonuclease subunit S n=1 Tax=Nostoc sp. NMS1 TaxID=2815388 RepID=UPI0025E5B1AF|nr:restriction endonuclease subunit S [Nostoc sp. NMS1]MBN3909294.1 restriction endonuclease subunit S [Nostoc sp. NMS1]